MKYFFLQITLILTVFSVNALSQEPTPSPESTVKARPNSSFVIGNAVSASEVPVSGDGIISAGVINGKAVSLITPPFPPAAKAVGAGGAVNVQATIDEQGNVARADAVSGHPLLRQAAEQAARMSKFSPTFVAGRAVKVTGIIVYNFVSNNSRTPSSLSPEVLSKIEKSNWMRWSMTMTYIALEKDASINSASLFLANALPNNFVSEKELLRQIPASPQNRAKIISDIYNLLGEKVQKSDLWQIELGKAIGKVNCQIRHTIFEESYNLDSEELRKNLSKIKDLSKSVPEDFPVDLNEPLTKLGNLSENANFSDANTLILVARNIQQVLTKTSISQIR